MEVHAKLRKLLNDRGWTEYRLSKECGLSESTLANIFRRNTLPSLPTLEAICNGLGVTISQFLAEGDMVEMTPELNELFQAWRSLTAEQKNAVIHLIRTMNSSK